MNAADKVLINEVTLQNVLSFGPNTPALKLNNLNVLIGPNGSGKSNLIESVSLLRALPGDLAAAFRRGGGFSEWIWKGESWGAAVFDFLIGKSVGNSIKEPLRHKLTFRMSGNQSYRLTDERIGDEKSSDTDFHYLSSEGTAASVKWDAGEKNQKLFNVQTEKSILAQRRDPEYYREISYLADVYEKIRTYREWTFGRNSIFRAPQKADLRNDRLEEDFSNLGLFLNRLRRNPAVKNKILHALGDLYEGFTDFDVSVEGGTVQVFFTEGDFTIPATRLSDGTLRYLCLLAILLDPNPPPLICIEEPELGLHPDVLTKLADHLIDASTRTQLIVTTHSDIIVDALSDQPESIIVCEKHEGQTEMRRLNSDGLSEWLKEYRLGQLWMKGHLGGTRW